MTTLVGTGKLIRLILRRDRLLLPLWILGFGVLMIAIASSYAGLFPTAAARQEYADASAANAGFVALYGRLYGASLGELATWRAGFYPVLVGLVSLLTVIRHTAPRRRPGAASCSAQAWSAGTPAWRRRWPRPWAPTWSWPRWWRCA